MFKKLTLVASDLAAFYGALALILVVRYGASAWQMQWSIHRAPFSILLIAWLFALYIANLYDTRIMRNDRDFFARLAQATGVASIASVLFFYLIPYFGIAPKMNLFFFLVVCALLFASTRFLYNRVIAVGTKERLLIVGVNQESLELVDFIRANPQFGYGIGAVVGLEELKKIDAIIFEHRIDTVIISPEAYQMQEVVDVFYRTLSRRVDFVGLAAFMERLTGRVPLGAIDQMWFLDNMTEGSKRSFDVGKRVFDVAAAIVLGIPALILTPFIASAIWLESPGPIFFKNRRTGQGGTSFDMIKFRSMRPNAEATTGAVWAKDNDPRTTRIGRLLRKSRIDELPQLWNILKGDMSLIGPRAERPEFDAMLSGQIPFYRERYLIKPGLSGWAQINYPYGSSVQDAAQKLQYDLYYIKHRSPILDLEIILKTVNISLRRAGR